MTLPDTFDKLFNEANERRLYSRLIQQLNKDLRFAAVDQQFSETLTPEVLKQKLQQLVQQLMEFEFGKYLNLLYIVDVSEQRIKQLTSVEIHHLSAEVAFLILQREWQKVVIRQSLG